MQTDQSGGGVSPPPEYSPLAQPPAMTIREVDLAMTGLTISLFVAALSNLVVLTALPRIVSDLHGSQASYTWIITASMLTMTVCMPIWGQMSDMLDKKRLIQACVLGYVLSSVCAGSSGAPWVIVVCRIAIGVCASGIIILMQAIAVDITTPRHRARWIGYRGAVMSVATVGAPTLGGFIAQHFGWRWCFFLAAPIAIVSIVMTQRTLHLSRHKPARRPQIDWLGALLLAGGTIALMLWVSVVGPSRGWSSPIAFGTLLPGIALLVLAVQVERRVASPMLPLDLLANREVLMCVIGSAATGFAFFGSAVFLAIFLQIGHGLSPQTAGLMALPEAGSTLLGAVVSSRFIARHGRYKTCLVMGATMVSCGFLLLATIGTGTALPFIALCVALIGGGLGMVSENLVLVVQTVVARDRAGSAGAIVNFFRMVGGITCVATLGALLSHRVVGYAQSHGMPLYDGSSVPNLSLLAGPQRSVIEAAYASGVAGLYLACVPVALMMLASVCLLRNGLLEADPHPDTMLQDTAIALAKPVPMRNSCDDPQTRM